MSEKLSASKSLIPGVFFLLELLMCSLPEPLLPDKAKTLCKTCLGYGNPQPCVAYGTGSTDPGEQGADCFFTGACRSVELHVLNGKMKF